MDRKSALGYAQKYAASVRSELSPQSIMLFGSCVNGNATDESDIDIAVIFDGFSGEWLETATRLWRISYDVDDRIEPHLIDKQQDKTGFADQVLKTGVAV